MTTTLWRCSCSTDLLSPLISSAASAVCRHYGPASATPAFRHLRSATTLATGLRQVTGFTGSPSNSIVYDNVRKTITTHEVWSSLECPLLASFESNQLPANSPTEDRRFLGKWISSSDPNVASTYCFGVIDGHGGHRCAQAVNERLLGYLAVCSADLQLLDEAMQSDNVSNSKSIYERLKMPNDYYTIRYQQMYNRSLLRLAEERLKGSIVYDSPAEAMGAAFERLDNDLLTEAINESVTYGGNIDLKAIERAYSGACACVVSVSSDRVVVANAGDCAAVIGRRDHKTNQWSAEQLTKPHTADNKAELQRLLDAHPSSEHRSIIHGDRLFGQLMPLRAFGNMRFKLHPEDLRKLHPIVDLGDFVDNFCLTPPYLSASPELTELKLGFPDDKFLIVASDGLWDFLSPDEAVNIVVEHLEQTMDPLPQDKPTGLGLSLSQLAHRDDKMNKTNGVESMCRDNAATRLICFAVGQSEHGGRSRRPELAHLQHMLTLQPDVVRYHRDDITVMVIFLQ